VLGALTTGEFSWGTFTRALGAYARAQGRRRLGGREIAPAVARIGVQESRRGGKAFAQLHAALALRHFGRDLARNLVWESLSADEREAWRSLLDPRRFYDPKTERVIELPENYLGVAARIAALAFEMGVVADRPFVDALIDRAVRPFADGSLYADDAGGAGRFDRYSNEYARYVFEAAESVGREDVTRMLARSLSAQMRLWWDLLAPDGYGYPWGRTLGVVSYLDTLEIAAFLGRQPRFRPAPLEDIAAAYRRAWLWLRHDYRDAAHLLKVFAPGRGNYAYITREREWQQTVGFFGKALEAHATLMDALERERVAVIPEAPKLPRVARFEWFRRGERPAGAWLVREGPLRFALPITTGTTAGVADYLPAPHGQPGFAAPVEQLMPALVPFFELADGRVIVATDGADAIEPSADGRSLLATWRRFAVVGGATGSFVEPGFTTRVSWRVEGAALVRSETLSAERDLGLRFRVSLPSTARKAAPVVRDGRQGQRFESADGVLEVSYAAPFALSAGVSGLGDEPLGRGARGAVPTHLNLEAREVRLAAGRPQTWEIRLAAEEPRREVHR
jgi:hypothetical protein